MTAPSEEFLERCLVGLWEEIGTSVDALLIKQHRSTLQGVIANLEYWESAALYTAEFYSHDIRGMAACHSARITRAWIDHFRRIANEDIPS